jgi:hypothetical protein
MSVFGQDNISECYAAFPALEPILIEERKAQDDESGKLSLPVPNGD